MNDNTDNLVIFDNSQYNIYVNKEINQKFENIKIMSKLINYYIELYQLINEEFIFLNYKFKCNNKELLHLKFHFSPIENNYFLNCISIEDYRTNEAYQYNNINKFLIALDIFIKLL